MDFECVDDVDDVRDEVRMTLMAMQIINTRKVDQVDPMRLLILAPFLPLECFHYFWNVPLLPKNKTSSELITFYFQLYPITTCQNIECITMMMLSIQTVS